MKKEVAKKAPAKKAAAKELLVTTNKRITAKAAYSRANDAIALYEILRDQELRDYIEHSDAVKLVYRRVDSLTTLAIVSFGLGAIALALAAYIIIWVV